MYMVKDMCIFYMLLPFEILISLMVAYTIYNGLIECVENCFEFIQCIKGDKHANITNIKRLIRRT